MGDELLKEAAAAWRLTLRVSDFIARHGREEFAVLIPRCPPASAVDVIDRLRPVTPREQTFSAGIVHCDGSESAESFVGRADRLLYQAKERGRDRPSPPRRLREEAC